MAKSKGGRPRFAPTDAQRTTVRVMAACGAPHEAICQAVINDQTGRPIDTKTLRLAFRSELDDGKATANAMVAQSLFKRAIGSGPQSVTAAIFWMKAQAGWRDTPGNTPAAGMTAADIADELRRNGAEAERDQQ